MMGSSVQALMNGVVLAVDRQHGHASPPRRVHDDAAGHDQDFFVGQGDGFPAFDRGQHGVQARGAGRSKQHDVNIGVRGDGNQGVGPLSTARQAALTTAPARP